MLNGWLRERWQRPVEERVPVAVLVDTAELEQCLGALANPTHTAVVEAEPDEMLHSAFDGAGADLEIEVDEPLVVHHGEALGEVLDGLLKPFASAFVSRTLTRDAAECRAQLFE